MRDRAEIETMIGRVALGDRSAFHELYDATSAKLFGVTLRILGDRSEAEDAIQEIYVKIWRAASAYQVNGLSPMTWLITIARNHSIDRVRARKTAGAGMEEIANLPDKAPGPEAQALASAERARIEACLGELKQDRAEAVRRAYLDGDTYKELASRYSVPLNTIRTWLRRSLLQLRECMSR